MQAERVSNVQEVAQLHLVSGFHSLDRRPVEAARVGEHLLCHGLATAPYSDAVADGPAGFENPLGLIGWHPPNALPIMSECQQQI